MTDAVFQGVLAAAMGVSLAACAGLRAFLPLLAAGLAVRFGWWPVETWMQWAGTNEALGIFGTATVLEVLADKVPLLDHALDAVHTVARPAAGALVAVGAFTQVAPVYGVALGIIVGAPLAGAFHLSKTGTRLASTGLTGGAGNPVLSVLEDAAAVVGVVLAFIAPLLAVVLLALLGAIVYRRVRRWSALRRQSPL